MMLDLNAEAIRLLQELLIVLDDAAKQHSVCHPSEEVIEPWTPSDCEYEIDCPNFTVDTLHKAQRIKKLLKM